MTFLIRMTKGQHQGCHNVIYAKCPAGVSQAWKAPAMTGPASRFVASGPCRDIGTPRAPREEERVSRARTASCLYVHA